MQTALARSQPCNRARPRPLDPEPGGLAPQRCTTHPQRARWARVLAFPRGHGFLSRTCLRCGCKKSRVHAL
eukprot:6926354-Alexandrium_andersonii.AAC.1